MPISANAASKVKLNKASLTLTVGKTSTLKISGTSSTVKWSSSKKSVATVTAKGVVKGVSAGSATIKAKVNGKTYSCKVTVKNANATAKSLKFKTSDGGVFIAGTSTAKVSFKLSKTSTNVVVSIKSSSGTTVYKKTYSKCTSGTTYSFTWDGKKSSGSAASAGTYTVSVKAGSKTTTSSSLVIKKQVFAGGTGSKSNPFQVSTLAQFLKIPEYNGYYFKQTANINGGLQVISGFFSSDNLFTGTYDGNGKTISNLIIQDSSRDEIALFGGVGANGVIKRLTLSDITVIGTYSTACLVATNYGNITDCVVKDCSVTSTGRYTGILCMKNMEGGTVSGCTVTGCVSSVSNSNWGTVRNGGLANSNYGKMIDCTISDCSIKVVSRATADFYVSGLVANNKGTLMNSGATGMEVATSGSGKWYVGGICALNEGVVSGCYFTGSASNDGIGVNNGTYIQ
ncbi:MAG: Ig-like domain-containing protein [Clostridiales bacterium]|nr:Ig-like domain-containing protein [Clostridiales bacterium]